VNSEQSVSVQLKVAVGRVQVRGYNRIAALARGDVLVFLQDDDLLPKSCQWLQRTLDAFASFPSLALLGYQVWTTHTPPHHPFRAYAA
jgi:hypothetical protein